jgi:hypothetical protein
MMSLRMPPDLRIRIDTWAAHQDDQPPRSEAIRRLIERGLAGEGGDMPSVTPAETARASKPRKVTKAASAKKARPRRP